MTGTLGFLDVINAEGGTIATAALDIMIAGTSAAAAVVALWSGADIVGPSNGLPVADATLAAALTTAIANQGTIITDLGAIGTNQTIGISQLGSINVALASSVGVDQSANAPAGPGTATTWTFNGVLLTLLKTIAANPNRHAIQVNNTTGALAVVVLDDGANGAGTVSLFPLVPGTGPFLQGGDLTPTRELGRVRIFGLAGTYCYARET
jgi:hypothetical protein